jgi:hypothetical protein
MKQTIAAAIILAGVLAVSAQAQPGVELSCSRTSEQGNHLRLRCQAASDPSGVVVAGGSAYPFTNAGLQSCIDDAQKPGSAGVCDARSAGLVPISAPLTDNGEPVLLQLGNSTVLACQTKPCLVLRSATGGAIEGAVPPDVWTARAGAQIVCSDPSTGNCIEEENANGIVLRNLVVNLQSSGSGSAGIHSDGCRYCRYENLKFQNIPADGSDIQIVLAPGHGAQNTRFFNISDDSTGGTTLPTVTGIDLEGNTAVRVTMPYLEKVHVNGFKFSYVAGLTMVNCTNDASASSPALHLDNVSDAVILGMDIESSVGSTTIGLDIGPGVNGLFADVNFGGWSGSGTRIAGNPAGGCVFGNVNALPEGFPACWGHWEFH